MKSVVRDNILIQLRAMDRGEKLTKSLQIQTQLKQLLKDESGAWVAFQNMSDEPELKWNEVSENINWAFPKIENDQLAFQSSSKSFKKSALGFQEPTDGVKITLPEIQGFVIPGLAYDKAGYRLGRGKAYYDRSLGAYQGKKIGVCFGLSLCEELPHEEHDIQVQKIVTENEIIKVQEAEGVSKWN